ncbi:MAG: PH domain-containing protein [Candidatus Berkelbacteria bacterium]|nr:PH domain-containing protein [Candidatus Berkelbacteria bacterium]
MRIESFEGQREDEEIKAVWQQHPWVLSKAAILIIVIIFIGSLPLAIFSPSWGVKLILLSIGIAGLYGILSYYLWLNTVYILTNERIFAIFQRHLFHRTNNEVPLSNIQNVSHSKKGIWQTMFDFGEVEIETSGAKTAMILKNVGNPYQVQQKILSKELEKEN